MSQSATPLMVYRKLCFRCTQNYLDKLTLAALHMSRANEARNFERACKTRRASVSEACAQSGEPEAKTDSVFRRLHTNDYAHEPKAKCPQ